jgi:hypothetical protein
MVKIQVEVFWVVTHCSVVVGYQQFIGPYFFLLQGKCKGSKVLQNVDILLQHYRASQPIRPQHVLYHSFTDVVCQNMDFMHC